MSESESFDATWSWLLRRLVVVAFASTCVGGVSFWLCMDWWLNGTQLTAAGQKGFFWIGAVVGLATGIIAGIAMTTYFDSNTPRPGMWLVFLGGSAIAALLASGVLSCLISMSNFPFPRDWF